MKKNYVLLSATIALLVSISSNVKAQETVNSAFGPRNNINAYVGLIEFNINYERNIIQASKSHSNVRLGVGYGAFYVAGEGNYINAALVHVFGSRSSHLEIDLGIKYMLTNSIPDPKFFDTVIPDAFLGYRFEKPSGGLIFRAGLNYTTYFNVGFGYKF